MPYERCDTLGHQGVGACQNQLTRYHPKKLKATTGEDMWSEGTNGEKPLPIIHDMFIGKESQDIDLAPYKSFRGMLSPWNLICAQSTKKLNAKSDLKYSAAETTTSESVGFHVIKPKEVSLGQEKDIQTHFEKYLIWKANPNRTPYLILLGISRGTAATWGGFVTHRYPEVKLVILEGAIDSIESIIDVRGKRLISSETLRNVTTSLVYTGLSLFTSYKKGGISPLSTVDLYPENVPTVFVSSLIDKIVPFENTARIAHALADRGKNEVYFIILPNSAHGHYSLGPDRYYYAAVMNAIYKRYNIYHDQNFAKIGEQYIDSCLLKPNATMNLRAAGL